MTSLTLIATEFRTVQMRGIWCLAKKWEMRNHINVWWFRHNWILFITFYFIPSLEKQKQQFGKIKQK